MVSWIGSFASSLTTDFQNDLSFSVKGTHHVHNCIIRSIVKSATSCGFLSLKNLNAPSFPSSSDELLAVVTREGINLNEYGDVLRLHDDKVFHVRQSKSVEDWKADPSVILATENGLPPGWVKIVRRRPGNRNLVFFQSPTRASIRWASQILFQNFGFFVTDVLTNKRFDVWRRTYKELQAVAEKEGVSLCEYGDALEFTMGEVSLGASTSTLGDANDYPDDNSSITTSQHGWVGEFGEQVFHQLQQTGFR